MMDFVLVKFENDNSGDVVPFAWLSENKDSTVWPKTIENFIKGCVQPFKKWQKWKVSLLSDDHCRSKRQASPLPEAELRDASQQTTLPHKKRPFIACPVQKNPQEQLLDSLTQKLDDDYGQFDASDSEGEQSLVDCSHSDVIAFSSQPGRGYACNPVIESPDQVCYRTRNRAEAITSLPATETSREGREQFILSVIS
ncbi:unnamed protein product [Bemisia tabaci]|uniref:Uncharacterized protein n=1 Tax=Bemisia tabaci TaxID=7038 RepID=A0A9P0EXN8_BEMTA|nr:unnamed protein product [Bemisia tabaci]